MEKQRLEKERKKEARNNALYNSGGAHRCGDDNLETFIENFESISGQEFGLPLVKREGFVVKEEADYFFSSLYTLLSEKFVLDFEDYKIELKASHKT